MGKENRHGLLSMPCARSGRTSRRSVESVLSAVQSDLGFMELVEGERAKVNADLAERRALAAARCCDAKPPIPHREHEGNPEMMILTSNIKQVRGLR